MKQGQERSYFAALDWASDHHDLVVLDRAGELVESLTFAHCGVGWQELRARLARLILSWRLQSRPTRARPCNS
jgi:hypothetical protein